MNLLLTYPYTTVNDTFCQSSGRVNFSPITHDFKNPIVKGRPNSDFRFSADFYKKIGVDIVTETVFNYPYPFITEKTYRPIAESRPFIIVGPPLVLRLLKELGFCTFSAIIDETYDSILNPEERFLSVCDSIKNFVSRPVACVKQDLYNVSDILKHNHSQLLKLADDELERFKAQI